MVVHEEQTQDPQQPMLHELAPLRRSMRERRSAISDDYVVFLKKNEDSNNGVMEDDPITVRQAIQDPNSEKWIEAMREEYKSMQHNKVWELVQLPEGVKPVGCKWLFKTKRDPNENEGLTLKRLFLQFHQKTLLGQLWLLLYIMIWSFIKWMSKRRFSMVTLTRRFIWCNQKILCRETQRIWFAN